ncbi:methyltransferase domain-containing protein [Nitrospirillum viridazoti]|uniref:Methyltransferase type 11 domain-containing protein n=1 Tax=Nitrospirillum viridazoti CBAmc TaxID=1441467 RepID=A0A248K1S4_9PROT|nr:methyltransferase domain-containing protein [Nitrospirillum amazonense]ASG24706.1 hypothetical protein Y958_28075 [Nitrospirillum amazonense CBAmc]
MTDVSFYFPRPDNQLEFTGERYVSGVLGGIQHEHYHRYLFAASLCRGKDVIDVASGEGYGSFLLGQVARSVTGIDIDQPAVDFANAHYGSDNVRYRHGDAAHLDLPDASIDVVVSFETLEHFQEQERFIENVARILRHDGLLIISSPNRDVYTEAADYHNPFHCRELNRQEFEGLLATHFPNVRIFEQRALTGSVILGADGVAEPAIDGYETEDGTHFKKSSGVPSPPYYIAIATRHVLPTVLNSVMQSPVHEKALETALASAQGKMGELYDEISRVNGEFALREAEVERLNGEISRVNGEFALREAEVERLNGEISRVNGEFALREAEVERLNGEISRVNGEFALREAEVERLNGEISRINGEFALREAEVERLNGEISRINGEFALREAEIARLNGEMSRVNGEFALREAEIARLNGEISHRDGEISRINGELALRKAEVAGLNDDLSSRDVELARLKANAFERDKRQVFMSREINRHLATINARDGELLNRDHEMSRLAQEAADIGAQLVARDAVLAALYGSASWRFTAPLRLAGKVSRRVLRSGASVRLRLFMGWLVTGQLQARLKERRLVRFINASGVFDTDFYLSQYPDVAASGVVPVLHYVAWGAAEGRQPNAWFHRTGYVAKGDNPLVRWIGDRRRQGLPIVDAGSAPADGTVIEDGPATSLVSNASWPRFAPADHPEVTVLLLGGDPEGARASLVSLGDESIKVVAVAEWAADPAWKQQCDSAGIEVADTGEQSLPAVINRSILTSGSPQLLLLTAGTQLAPGWRDALTQAQALFPQAGLVTACHLTEDGRVAAAGLCIHADGTISPNAAGLPADHYAVASVQDVDGAGSGALFVARSLWQEVGGLSEDYLGLGYALADFSMRLRDLNRATVCQPFAPVVGAPPLGAPEPWTLSHDRWRFRQEWARALGGTGLVLDRQLSYRAMRRPRVLFIDHLTPEVDKDSGSADIFWFMRIFLELGYDVTFVPAHSLAHASRYTDDLRRLGVTCVCAPYVDSAAGFVEAHGAEFDLVMLYRVTVACHLIDPLLRHAINARIVFDTVDLHFVREERQAVMMRSPQMLEQANYTRAVELDVASRADCTIVLSEQEYRLLDEILPQAPKRLIPIVRDIPGRSAPFETRRDIVFIGGFAHQPNVDAILTFVAEIWPKVRHLLPDVILRIVGSNPTAEVLALHAPDQGVVVVGYVADLTETFANCRITVAPLRFGAGIKGKVVTSLSYGVPCVASKVAVEGMGLKTGLNILTAETPDDYAAAIAALYQERELWQRLSDGGIAFATERFSIPAITAQLKEMLRFLNLPVPR